MPSLKDILGGVVKDAGKVVDNAVSGNQRQNNRQQNKSGVTFADILNQYRQQPRSQQQSRPQQQEQSVQQVQQYNAPQISEQQKKDEPAQKKQESGKEEDKENRKRFNDAAANALKGMLFGGAANAANLLLSPDEANAEEAKRSDTELNPDVEIGGEVSKDREIEAAEEENKAMSQGQADVYRDANGEWRPKTPKSFEAAIENSAAASRNNGPRNSNIQDIASNMNKNSDKPKAFETPDLSFDQMTDQQREEYYQRLLEDPTAILALQGNYHPEADFSNLVAAGDIPLSSVPNLRTSSPLTREDALGVSLIQDLGLTNPEDMEDIMKISKLAGKQDQINAGLDEATRSKIDDLVNGQRERDEQREKERNGELTDKQISDLEDEMRAMSNAQAYLLENPGATMGGHKIGDQTINELMSEVGNNGEGYLKNEERPELGSYTADDLESMSDIVLYDLALRDPDFQKYMTDTYGAGYGNVNAFFDQYLNTDNGEDKEAITRDIFLGNDAFELDPVLQAQLMQRVYNGNADLANMDPDKQGDEIVKAIMEQYGFDNPLDVALWGSDEGYQNENPLTYDREAALVGAMFFNMMDGYGGKLSDIGLSPEDIALYAAIGNSDIRGNAFDDRYNGLLSQYDRDEFLDLIGLSGYKDEFKKLNFNNDNTDGKGEYTYRDWKDPGRNWSMASLYDAAAQAQTPEELQQTLGVLQSDASYNPVFIDAADRLFDRGWQHGYKYGARTPQSEG